MNNKMRSEIIAMCVFACCFMFSIQLASMLFMSIAMFALSVALKRFGGKTGFICFLLGCGFLFSSIVSPVFNAMGQTPTYHFSSFH